MFNQDNQIPPGQPPQWTPQPQQFQPQGQGQQPPQPQQWAQPAPMPPQAPQGYQPLFPLTSLAQLQPVQAQPVQAPAEPASDSDRLRELETQLAEYQRERINAVRDRVIYEALAGRRFVGNNPAAANQLARLLADDIEVVRAATGDLVAVARGTQQPAGEILSQRLDSEEFAHYFAPFGPGSINPYAGPAPAVQPTGLNGPLSQNPPPGSVEAIAKAWAANSGKSRGLTGRPTNETAIK